MDENIEPTTSYMNPNKLPQKKLVFKGFKGIYILYYFILVPPKTPDGYVEETWDLLYKAVQSIKKTGTMPFGQERLYKSCENLCRHQWQKTMYERLLSELDVFVKSITDTIQRYCMSI